MIYLPVSSGWSWMAKLHVDMKHTIMELKRLGMKRASSKPLASPFVNRQNSAFDRLMEVCECSPTHNWADDSEDDDTNNIKMEIPSFDGRKLSAFAETFVRYFVLTAVMRTQSTVKANLIEHGIMDKDLQDRVSTPLKTSNGLGDFLESLQSLNLHDVTDLSVIGEIHKLQHLPYDPKPEAAAKPLHNLDVNLNKLNPGDLSGQQTVLQLVSKINDKQFAEWTKYPDLSEWMHLYQELADVMVERRELSLTLKHVAINRGHCYR